MAFKNKISACIENSCSVMQVTEITGLYNVNSNTTGWDITDSDSPDNTTNPDKAITSATLQVRAPSQSTFTTFTVTTAITSSSAYVETFPLVTIANTDVVSGSTYFESGRWEFIYTIVDSDGTEYIKKFSKVFFCRERCCVDQLYTTWLESYCGCDDCQAEDEMKQIEMAENLLAGLEVSGECLTDARIEEVLDCVGRICSIDNCCS